MTTSQIIACAISMPSAAIAITALLLTRRQVRRNEQARRERDRSFPVCEGGGVVTVPARMSDAEYEAFKACWQERHGKPGTAHPVTDVGEEESGA